MQALEPLKREHDAILRVLDRLERVVDQWRQGGDLDVDTARKLSLHLNLFGVRHHLAADADVLFPLLKLRGISPSLGPLAVVRCLQEEGAWYVRSLSSAEKSLVRGRDGGEARFAENAEGAVSFLRDAIAREESILLPLARETLSREDREVLGTALARHEARALDPILREACDRILASLDEPRGKPHGPRRRRPSERPHLVRL